jgi:hypothetical protein
VGVQFGVRFTRSAPLTLEKSVHIKPRFPFQPVVDRPSQLVGQEGPGFPLIVGFLQAGQRFLPRLVVPQKQHGGFGKGPLEVRMANLFA